MSSMLAWLVVFERRRTDLQSVCVAGCAVIHCAVIGCLQVDYRQRAVLCFVSGHISSDVKMLCESFLQISDVVGNMSDAFQSSAFRAFLKPVHEPVVGFLVAADQLDCVSRASEEIGRSLMDLNTKTNAWKKNEMREMCRNFGSTVCPECQERLPMSQDSQNNERMLNSSLNDYTTLSGSVDSLSTLSFPITRASHIIFSVVR